MPDESKSETADPNPAITALELKLLGSVSAVRNSVRVPGKPYPPDVPDSLLEQAAAEIRRLRIANVKAEAALMTIMVFPGKAREIARKAMGGTST